MYTSVRLDSSSARKGTGRNSVYPLAIGASFQSGSSSTPSILMTPVARLAVIFLGAGVCATLIKQLIVSTAKAKVVLILMVILYSVKTHIGPRASETLAYCALTNTGSNKGNSQNLGGRLELSESLHFPDEWLKRHGVNFLFA